MSPITKWFIEACLNTKSVSTLEETIEEDDWDGFRSLVHSKATLALKQEDEQVPLPIEEVVVVPLADVWPLQKSISCRFRHGSAQFHGGVYPRPLANQNVPH